MFSSSDRKMLLAVKGVGPAVIARLEQMGYSNLRDLAAADARQIVEGAAALSVKWTRTDWYAVLVAARGIGLP